MLQVCSCCCYVCRRKGNPFLTTLALVNIMWIGTFSPKGRRLSMPLASEATIVVCWWVSESQLSLSTKHWFGGGFPF